MTTQDVIDKLKAVTVVRRSGAGWKVICPFHPDTEPSLNVSSEGLWYCFACNMGGNLSKLSAMLDGVQQVQPCNHSSRRRRNTSREGIGTITAEYIYRDEQGKPLYKVARFTPKSFRQMRWTNWGWGWGLGNTRRVLYHLDQIVARPTEVVVLVEGEKDADFLMKAGILTTTCPMGAGKWRCEYGESLRNRRVVLIPDNDKVGMEHMTEILNYLLKNKIADAGIVTIPTQFKDVSEWGDVAGIKELIRKKAEVG